MILPRRLPHLSPAQERLARASRRALLTAEAAVLVDARRAAVAASAALLAAAAAVPARARLAVLLAGRTVAERLRADLASALLAGRTAARSSARARLAAEIHAAGAPSLSLPPSSLGHTEDAAHAEAAADSFAAAWRAALTASVVAWSRAPEPGSLPSALATAAAQQDHRLQRIATTETARAFSAEHDEATRRVAREHAGAVWLPLLVKRWDATLDRRACPICKDMDGRLALPLAHWRLDRLPGWVHVGCRCVSTLIVLPLRFRQRDAAEDLAA